MKNTYEIRGEITAIFVRYKGKELETIIDTNDLRKADEYKGTWYAYWNIVAKALYVTGGLANGKYKRTSLYLHRWLLDAKKGSIVDHINHDTLCNTRKNLRIVNHSQNAQNRKGHTRTNSSGIRGVTWHKRLKKWHARIVLNGKSVHLGYFTDKKEAGKVASEARKNHMPYSSEYNQKRSV